MKSNKLYYLFFLGLLIWSCDDNDDSDIVTLSEQPSFTITESAENSSIYYLENTTADKGEFYSYWEFSDETAKYADNGVLEHQFGTAGDKTVTLTMVGTSSYLQTTQSLTVVLPPPTDVRFLTNPENLIQNAYFVDGDDNDFTNWNKNNGSDRITSETVEVLVGYRAAKVMNPADGNPWDTQFVTDGIATENGADYTVSLWAKGDPSVIRFSTNPGVGGDQYAGDYTITEDWGQYSFTFTANSETTLIALDMGATSGNFIIDAVEMVKGTSALGLPSNDSELLNGGLEEGEGDDFTNWNKYNGGDRVIAEVTQVLSGSRAMRVNNPADGNPWDTQFVSDAFPTEDGQEYTVSLWAKGDPVVMRYSTNPGVGGEQYAGDYTVTEDWQQYSWSFTANSATTLIAMDMGATGGSFVIDNIKVVKN